MPHEDGSKCVTKSCREEGCKGCPQFLDAAACICYNQIWCKKCGNKLCYRDTDGICQVNLIPGAAPNKLWTE